MNKKLLVVSILAVLMLVAISFASALTTNTTNTKKKESPLFGIRTRLAIGERLEDLKEIIKARFIRDRVFFLPFQWLRNGERPYRLMNKEDTENFCTYAKNPLCTWDHDTCNTGSCGQPCL